MWRYPSLIDSITRRVFTFRFYSELAREEEDVVLKHIQDCQRGHHQIIAEPCYLCINDNVKSHFKKNMPSWVDEQRHKASTYSNAGQRQWSWFGHQLWWDQRNRERVEESGEGAMRSHNRDTVTTPTNESTLPWAAGSQLRGNECLPFIWCVTWL
jgi:hypothetical protein